MAYDRHTSEPLLRLFASQEFPHQGQSPELARIVILGIDANYSPEISGSPEFFDRVIEYHEDGVQFWQKYGVHHPFLLPTYPLSRNTGGVPYHRKFSWMNLTPDYATHISFIELLPIPTTGSTQQERFWQLFDESHATRIDDLIKTGASRLIVLSQSLVANYMSRAKKRFGVFDWLPETFKLGEMKRIGETVIFGAPHFSSTTYTKDEFVRLGTHIRSFCSSAATSPQR